MGCAPSSFDLAVQNSQSMKKNLTQYSLLQLSDSDVRKLYDIFHGIDENNGDTVVLVEVLAHTNLPHKGFTAKIFSVFTDNNSGTIDFNEFVLALWNFCTLNKGTLDTFVFDLYDNDGTGELSSSQMLGMIEEMFGKNESKTNADIKPVVAELQDFERRKVVFNLDRFRSFVKKHPAMLVPVSHAMQVLQNKTLGVNTWERLAEKRTKLSSGRYLSVRKFIAAQGSGKPYTSLSTPGQSRDDESHHQDFAHEAGSSGAQESFAGGIKTTIAATSFELSDLASDSPCMTTSSKPSNGGLTDSAKVRWTASLQSLVTAVSAKHPRRSKTKVHASPKSFGASSGSGTNRNKPKSRTNSNSADGDVADSAKGGSASTPVGTFTKPTAFTATNTSTSVANLDPGSGGALETVRRKSVTFGDVAEGVPVVSATTATTSATARDAGSSSPKNADSARRNAPSNISPRPVAGAGAGAHAGNSPTASPTNATSARSTAGVGSSTSSQRRGSKDIVIWSNDSQTTQPTNISPKGSNHSPNNANSNNKNFHGHHGHYSNSSTPASTARTGMNGEGKEANLMAVFNDKMAFVPHDDAALAVRSRPAARRSVILPGAVEDAQDLNDYMNLHQQCRSLE